MTGSAWRGADALPRIRANLAALAVLNRGYALALKFNPAQPRVPAGSPAGGQWTSGGGGGSFVRVAGNRRRTWDPISLLEEEAAGGHTIEEHVGKTPAFLLAQVRGDRFALGDDEFVRKRDGSFPSLGAADKLVNSTLAQTRSRLSRLRTGNARAPWSWRTLSPRQELRPFASATIHSHIFERPMASASTSCMTRNRAEAIVSSPRTREETRSADGSS